jgi:hypothetical protein
MDEAWERWSESPWALADARDRLDQILDLAARQKPQRIRRESGRPWCWMRMRIML